MLHLENFQTFLDQLKKPTANSDNAPASYVHCNELFLEGFIPDTDLCWYQVLKDPNNLYKAKVFFDVKGKDETTDAKILFLCPVYTQRFNRNIEQKKNFLKKLDPNSKNYRILELELEELKGDISNFLDKK